MGFGKMQLSLAPKLKRLFAGSVFVGLAAVSAEAAVLLSTDFTGRTVAGATASNLTWTEAGLSTPTSMTVTNESPGALAGGGLFDTANAQGHFAVSKNIGNVGPWSVTIPLNLTSPQVSLESVDIDWQHYNNSGVFQGPARNVRWTVTVTGSASGLLDTVVGTANADSGLNNLAFGAPLALTDSETYDVKILVDNNGNATGNNTGFDALTFHGEIVPEPGSLALLGLGFFGVLLRRRR